MLQYSRGSHQDGQEVKSSSGSGANHGPALWDLAKIPKHAQITIRDSQHWQAQDWQLIGDWKKAAYVHLVCWKNDSQLSNRKHRISSLFTELNLIFFLICILKGNEGNAYGTCFGYFMYCVMPYGLVNIPWLPVHSLIMGPMSYGK